MTRKLLQIDPYLQPYKPELDLRMEKYVQKRNQLLLPWQSLSDFANGHAYFGFHKEAGGWYYREWAPGAEAMYLTGDFCGWNRHAHPMSKKDGGVFELFLPGEDALKHGQQVMTIVVHQGQELDRIPLYANYVLQDPATHQWNASLFLPETPFAWTDKGFLPQKNLFIYECHIGMAQEEPKVGSYAEFTNLILPRIKALGYNTIQIMAIMEHPYYASFGYQVTNLFAPSSRFGTPDELRSLINTAHSMGIAVLLDVVHSHASKNTREGINEFDGTDHQFFHAGAKGDHTAWGTKCFDYNKNEVIHFLLSNLKYWLEEFHFDGFRFDGITSMLYHNHGLGQSFNSYPDYFSLNTDTDAVTFLQLANDLVREINPHAITIAEDTSALPGLCLPVSWGGVGFDYRLAMGVPDMWIRLLKETPDENWDLGHIYYALTNRRPREKVIGYCESHDQALVGDKTIMFRLCDSAMYDSMEISNPNLVVERGMALHKMLRLLTMSLGGEGYLTFMGNEFGHPEWIDFPREGNNWSYHYCRRQWSLADNPNLKYQYLNRFEAAMVSLAKRQRILSSKDRPLLAHNADKVLCYRKGSSLFVYNFHATQSFGDYFVPVDKAGEYTVVLSSDDFAFGGHGRVHHLTYTARKQPDGRIGFQMYLPSRTATVLKKK